MAAIPEIRIYKSRRKAALLLLGCAAFVAMGVFLLNHPDAPRWVAWLNIGFFGLGIPISIYTMLDRRPQIIINEVGIFDRTTHQSFINWEIIQDVYLAEIHGQQFICLVVDEAFEPSQHKGKWGRSMARFSKELGFQELNISLGSVRINAGRLAEFIVAMRNATPSAREFLLHKQLAQPL
ncbi:STM3941 family protein [Hymenobacter sp. ASUV-10]|uniref:STM3941 family protein n=1 Tax=Hymenobacter aranciens TaxID=3063996 RepID=A0ABT9BFG1_9BACT|nr:STM3941 family protein [Hymenobacter sp. ASUV-10]MDO7876977.1 STM3941 family protein [Hymenobacter sp. ASUV-10]